MNSYQLTLQVKSEFRNLGIKLLLNSINKLGSKKKIKKGIIDEQVACMLDERLVSLLIAFSALLKEESGSASLQEAIQALKQEKFNEIEAIPQDISSMPIQNTGFTADVTYSPVLELYLDKLRIEYSLLYQIVAEVFRIVPPQDRFIPKKNPIIIANLFPRINGESMPEKICISVFYNGVKSLENKNLNFIFSLLEVAFGGSFPMDNIAAEAVIKDGAPIRDLFVFEFPYPVEFRKDIRIFSKDVLDNLPVFKKN